MNFLESPRFPDNISYGSKGGPEFNTTVVQVDSGYEHANINWLYPLADYDVSYGVRKRTDLYDLIKFFRVMYGRAYRFRYKDWADFKSHHGDQITQAISDIDQIIGTGDGIETVYQLIKTYDEGVFLSLRLIKKPVVGTVVIAFDGTPQPSGWTCDYTTGEITFSSAPGNGVVVTAGFEFDVPCRFTSDKIETNYDSYNSLSTSVGIMEVRL
jgi:uncharacterized protein (TIGR02217 family)